MTDQPTASTRRLHFRRRAWKPLTVTWEEVADRIFRRNAVWLRENLPADFPQPDPEYHLFHVEAVETWARRRWGVVPDVSGGEEAQAPAQAIMIARSHSAARSSHTDEGRTAPDSRRGEKAATVQEERPNYSVSLLAKRWGCTSSHVHSLVARGKLPHFRVGTLIRIRGANVRAYEEQHDTEAEPAVAAPAPKEIMATIRCNEGFRRGQESARRSLARKAP